MNKLLFVVLIITSTLVSADPSWEAKQKQSVCLQTLTSIFRDRDISMYQYERQLRRVVTQSQLFPSQEEMNNALFRVQQEQQKSVQYYKQLVDTHQCN